MIVSFEHYQRKAKRDELKEKLYQASIKLKFAFDVPDTAHKHRALADWMDALKKLEEFDRKAPEPA